MTGGGEMARAGGFGNFTQRASRTGTCQNLLARAGTPAESVYLFVMRPKWPRPGTPPGLKHKLSLSSHEGQIVLDAFCGCGTSLEAAAKLKRRWVGIDLSPTACRVMSDRLESL